MGKGPILHFSREGDRDREMRDRMEKKGAMSFRFQERDVRQHLPEAADSPNDNPIIVIATSPQEAYEVAGRTTEKNIKHRKEDGTTYPGKQSGDFSEIEADVKTDERK